MQFLQLVESLGAWGVAFAVTASTLGLWYRDLIDSDSERRAFVEHLSRNEYRERYRQVLKDLLDRLDKFFCDWEIRARELQSPGAVQEARLRNCAPWGYGLLDFALLAAILYPIGTIFLQWCIFGGPGQIGSIEIFAAEQDWRVRYATLCGLALYFTFVKWILGDRVQ